MRKRRNAETQKCRNNTAGIAALALGLAAFVFLLEGCLSGGHSRGAVEGDNQNAAIAALIKAEVTAAMELAVVSIRKEFKTSTGDIAGGAGSTITQITFQNVAGKAGWLFVPGIAAGWWSSRKKTVAALDTVIGAIEDKQCAECKACVRAAKNAAVNRRAAIVSAKKKTENLRRAEDENAALGMRALRSG